MHKSTRPSESRPRVQVLAPAGDGAALDAALASGADAVYFGLPGFNARARAANFAVDTLPETMARIHAAGAAGYVTLNTLVFDPEREAACDLIRACDDAHVDALIVQDLGVARWVRGLAPSMPLHASTQMTCTDVASFELAGSLGISRVVVPREWSLRDIERIHAATGLELEAFVHGALCVSYSGQCLASLSMGGRSANRGACAQPCRLPYTLVAEGHPDHTGFLLSPKDLDAAELIPGLLQAGVTSLKIEGRMKGPAYVAATVRLIRGVVRAWEQGVTASPDPEAHEAALQMFSRGSGPGFLQGTDHQSLVDPRSSDHRGLLLGTVESVRPVGGKTWIQLGTQCSLACGDGILIEGANTATTTDGSVHAELGGRVWLMRAAGGPVDKAEAGQDVSVWLGPERSPGESLRGRRVFRTSAPRMDAMVAGWLAQGRPRERISVTVRGQLGEHARFAATTATGQSAEVASSVPIVHAEKRPLTREVIAEKLGRLGETRFELGELEVSLPSDAMLPLSVLNDARRRLVDALNAPAPAQSPATRDLDPLALPSEPDAQAVVLCRRAHQVEAAVECGAKALVLDLPDGPSLLRTLERLRALGARTPWIGIATLRIRKPGESSLDELLLNYHPDGLLVRSLAGLSSLSSRADGPFVVADAFLNIANSTTARMVLSRGARSFTPSWDLPRDGAYDWFDADLMPYVEAVAYGQRPMFHTEHCLFAAHLSEGRDCASCDRPCERVSVSLRDRAGKLHPLRVDRAGRNTVFEGGNPERFEEARALQALGVRRFRAELLDETVEETREIVGALLRLV